MLAPANTFENNDFLSRRKYLNNNCYNYNKIHELVYKKHVRDQVTQIYIRNNNVKDCIYFHFNGNEKDILKFRYVKISLLVEIKEFRKSSDLFNGVAIEDKNGFAVKNWEYKRHRGDWEYYQIEADNLNLYQFYMGDGNFKVRLIYYCLQDHHFQDWYLRNVMMTFTLKDNPN